MPPKPRITAAADAKYPDARKKENPRENERHDKVYRDHGPQHHHWCAGRLPHLPPLHGRIPQREQRGRPRLHAEARGRHLLGRPG